MSSLPLISIPTVALFFAEVRGFSKLYDNVDDSPLGKLKQGLAGSRLFLPPCCFCVVTRPVWFCQVGRGSS